MKTILVVLGILLEMLIILALIELYRSVLVDIFGLMAEVFWLVVLMWFLSKKIKTKI